MANSRPALGALYASSPPARSVVRSHRQAVTSTGVGDHDVAFRARTTAMEPPWGVWKNSREVPFSAPKEEIKMGGRAHASKVGGVPSKDKWR